LRRQPDLDLDVAGGIPARPLRAGHRRRWHAVAERDDARLGSPRLLRGRAGRALADGFTMKKMKTYASALAIAALAGCASDPNYGGLDATPPPPPDGGPPPPPAPPEGGPHPRSAARRRGRGRRALVRPRRHDHLRGTAALFLVGHRLRGRVLGNVAGRRDDELRRRAVLQDGDRWRAAGRVHGRDRLGHLHARHGPDRG